jgi:hypothetical protein
MPKRHKQASKPIVKEDETDISESQKKHYARMGYRPYLSNGGKIKWLSFEQHIYEKIKYAKKNSLFTLRFIHTQKSRFVKYIHSIIRTILENWVLVLVIIIFTFALTFINQIISFISIF